MPVDMYALAGDLAAETAVTRDLVADLSEVGWRTPTPAVGWTIADQIGHLAYFDEMAVKSAVNPEEFAAELAAARASGADTDPDALAAGYRDSSGAQILTWFDAARATLLGTFARLDPGLRVPWFGPAMSAASSLTARFMETWAHTQDIADALGVTREPTARLRHVAHLGVVTRGFSFVNRGLPRPEWPVHVALTALSGDIWTWGDPEAVDRVSGPALDFCLLVTQRRHFDDLDLAVEGPGARQWMAIAQAFAGPPGVGRRPVQPWDPSDVSMGPSTPRPDPSSPSPDPSTASAHPSTPPADPSTLPADRPTPPADPATPPADPSTPPAEV